MNVKCLEPKLYLEAWFGVLCAHIDSMPVSQCFQRQLTLIPTSLWSQITPQNYELLCIKLEAAVELLRNLQ